MSTASLPDRKSSSEANSAPSKRVSRRRKTSHLKAVPESSELRERLRAKCRETAAKLDHANPLTKDEMEQLARSFLERENLPEKYVGWAMVMLSSAFWEDQVAATSPSRRLFLLPHCLKHAEGCPADYDEFGLDCKTCGACSIADFRTQAEEMGYKVLVAEGSPIVLKIIVSGYVDAIVGVACLNVLEKAIDKVLLAGIPCMAVPLLSSDCRNTSVDEAWVHEMLQLRSQEASRPTKTYVHLMREASHMFKPAELERLVPRLRGGLPLEQISKQPAGQLDAISATESIAHDFLTKGGKHSRPFITLAVYDALTGAHGTDAGGADHLRSLPDAVKRVAMSIETFHKASLVHDDIEDDDAFRYGEQTIHRRYGTATAINIGDYLIGMGYRLVSRESKSLGPDVVADILDRLAESHTRLSEGQGAELMWRDSLDKRLAPIDALKIYALKTAPAFEAALYSGVRLVQSEDDLNPSLRQFARNLGVAFQILNDLKDWEGDQDNKMLAGGDVLGGRPTVLWALALEALPEEKQQELIDLISDDSASTGHRIARVRQLYNEARVFEKAHRLVDKHQERAEAVADDITHEELRRLLYYLVDTVLDRQSTPDTPLAVVQPEIVLPGRIGAASS